MIYTYKYNRSWHHNYILWTFIQWWNIKIYQQIDLKLWITDWFMHGKTCLWQKCLNIVVEISQYIFVYKRFTLSKIRMWKTFVSKAPFIFIMKKFGESLCTQTIGLFCTNICCGKKFIFWMFPYTRLLKWT